MKDQKILGIQVQSESKRTILDKIIKYISQPTDFFHIVSLNPENLVIATENQGFKKVLQIAQMKLIDGVGVALAGRWLGVKVGERVAGVELMGELFKLANRMSLTVLLIGGQANLANEIAQCQQKNHLGAKIRGIQGIENIKNPTKSEEEAIFAIVADLRPNIILVAFGSPDQELWLASHSNQLKEIVCMGVGGGFDFFGKKVPRAPIFFQKIGLEWLFRLFIQPWRWRRQTRLLKFLWLILSTKRIS